MSFSGSTSRSRVLVLVNPGRASRQYMLGLARRAELLDQVRAMVSDDHARTRLGQAIRARTEAEHTWEARPPTMLAETVAAAQHEPQDALVVESAA